MAGKDESLPLIFARNKDGEIVVFFGWQAFSNDNSEGGETLEVIEDLGGEVNHFVHLLPEFDRFINDVARRYFPGAVTARQESCFTASLAKLLSKAAMVIHASGVKEGREMERKAFPHPPKEGRVWNSRP